MSLTAPLAALARPLRPPRQALAAACALLSVLFTGETRAQGPDAVEVVLAGGIRELETYDLIPQASALPGEPPLLMGTRLGEWSLGLTGATTRVSLTDAKRLPDGGLLAADFSGRGFVVLDASRAQVFALRPEGDYPPVTAASAAAFTPSGSPTQILFSEQGSASVYLYDLGQKRYVWYHSASIAGVPGSVVQVAAMPGQRVAMAINWGALGAAAIEITEPGAQRDARRLRLASEPQLVANATIYIVPELAEGIRDLMVLPDDRLLVTTPSRLLELDLTGAVLWQFDPGIDGLVQGELTSARLLASGNIALSTMEPGLYGGSHQNHRIYWIAPRSSEQAPSGAEILGKSPVLTRAPVRLELLEGHGGTGTFGFSAGLGEIAQGQVADVTPSRPLELVPQRTRPGTAVRALTGLTNAATAATRLRRLQLQARPGDCREASDQAPRALAEVVDVVLEPQASIDFALEFTVPQEMAPAQGERRWCASLLAEDTRGELAVLAGTADLWVEAGEVGQGRTLPRTALAFGLGEPEQTVRSEPTFEDAVILEGCGCGQTPGHACGASALGWAALVGLWLGWRRRSG